MMTNYVVRLKVFRLKVEGVQKARLTHLGENRANSHTKHGFPANAILDETSSISVFLDVV